MQNETRTHKIYAAVIAQACDLVGAQQYAALMCRAGVLRRAFVSAAEGIRWERQQAEMRSADEQWRQAQLPP